LLHRPTRSTLLPYTTLFRSIERLEHEHVIAFIRTGNEREEDGLAAAGRGQDLARLDRNADALHVVLPQRVEELRRAGGRRILERSEEHTSELQSLRHLVCRL